MDVFCCWWDMLLLLVVLGVEMQERQYMRPDGSDDVFYVVVEVFGEIKGESGGRGGRIWSW